MTNAEARCNRSLRPRKPEGSLGRTAQDIHLDSHTAPKLWETAHCLYNFYTVVSVFKGTFCAAVLGDQNKNVGFFVVVFCDTGLDFKMCKSSFIHSTAFI